MKTITESNYKDAIKKIKDFLKNKRNLDEYEINYVVTFYEQIKNLGMLDADYFKNFKSEGELFNFNNIQKFAKYPETFYDVVLNVLHNGAFLDLYNVEFDGLNVKLTKKAKLDKDDSNEKEASNLPPEYERYKLAEDDRYYTFHLPTPQVANSFMPFYKKMWPENKDIGRFVDAFNTGWCTTSNNNTENFKYYKPEPSSQWMVTFLKIDPAKELLKAMNKLYETDYKSLSEFPGASEKIRYKEIRNILGEKVLVDADGTFNKVPGSSKNHGYFNYANNPGSVAKESDLPIKPTYNYTTIFKNAGVDPFVITEGVLTRYAGSGGIVSIPPGVTEIAEDAFSDIRNVTGLILPPSLRIIQNKALEGIARSLKIIQATNNLELVKYGAFGKYTDAIKKKLDAMAEYIGQKDNVIDSKKDLFLFGVIEKDEKNLYKVKKPSNLIFYPRVIKNAYSDFESIKRGETTNEK
jgi:hypothetical protein